MDGRNITDQQQLLAELARAGSGNRQESSVVISPGARVTAWAVKVKSHVDYNVYNVCAVVIGANGSVPLEIGEPMEAVNLAEPFLSQGTVPAGKYGILCRVGVESRVFRLGALVSVSPGSQGSRHHREVYFLRPPIAEGPRAGARCRARLSWRSSWRTSAPTHRTSRPSAR